MKIWTTSLEVSQRIKELVGEKESTFKRIGELLVFKTDIGCYAKSGAGVMDHYLEDHEIVSVFTISELPTVLKKIGEVKEWAINSEHLYGTWAGHYIKVCELVATDGDANAYLLELLK